ncbi:hypothetical protein MIND_00389600 [Mycena indigotica]|uniref:Uncharacterized protein n=1 Tax=Mycena indigotica TaxID=2126181 RepID=A0A8H6T4E1_9AGAR|nr:uncharacterized protein MIND_00389600 [Mycena indigotica]KAF7310162.1 hypothetical protein MIND_00389600 [Mycena indigotica]
MPMPLFNAIDYRRTGARMTKGAFGAVTSLHRSLLIYSRPLNGSWEHKPVEGHATLKSCSLVSSALCGAAQRRLFANIRLMPVVDTDGYPDYAHWGADDALRFLDSAPHIPGYVRHLWVVHGSGWLEEAGAAAVIDRFERLEGITIDTHDHGDDFSSWDSFHGLVREALARQVARAQMRSLTLWSTPIDVLGELIRSAGHSPLAHVSLHELSVGGDIDEEGSPGSDGGSSDGDSDVPPLKLDALELLPRFLEHRSGLIDLRSLRYLHIRDEFYGVNDSILAHATSLERLCVSLGEQTHFSIGELEEPALSLEHMDKLHTFELALRLEHGLVADEAYDTDGPLQLLRCVPAHVPHVVVRLLIVDDTDNTGSQHPDPALVPGIEALLAPLAEWLAEAPSVPGVRRRLTMMLDVESENPDIEQIKPDMTAMLRGLFGGLDLDAEIEPIRALTVDNELDPRHAHSFPRPPNTLWK